MTSLLPLRAPNAAKRHWRRTLVLTWCLLGLWFAITLVTSFMPNALNQWNFLGFPLGYYMAAQGALLAYLVIIAVHTLIMNRLDRSYETPNTNSEAVSRSENRHN